MCAFFYKWMSFLILYKGTSMLILSCCTRLKFLVTHPDQNLLFCIWEEKCLPSPWYLIHKYPLALCSSCAPAVYLKQIAACAIPHAVCGWRKSGVGQKAQHGFNTLGDRGSVIVINHVWWSQNHFFHCNHVFICVSFSSVVNLFYFLIDWVDVANELLRRCHITQNIKHLSECGADVFVRLYESVLGEKVPGGNINF